MSILSFKNALHTMDKAHKALVYFSFSKQRTCTQVNMLACSQTQQSLPADVCFVEEKDGADHGQTRRGGVNNLPHSRAAATTF